MAFLEDFYHPKQLPQIDPNASIANRKQNVNVFVNRSVAGLKMSAVSELRSVERGIEVPVCLVLLRRLFPIDATLLQQILEALPGDWGARVDRVSDDAAKAHLVMMGRRFSIVCIEKPVPRQSFSQAFSRPNAADAHPLIDSHQAHLIVTGERIDESMEDAIEVAVGVHLLSAKIGGLGDPVAAFWTGSEQLRDWQSFTTHANVLISEAGEIRSENLPTRFWVSIQLTLSEDGIGGGTEGLKFFTDYEIDLTPVRWDMEDVAARLVGTVIYLFSAGPVLQDGETLGGNDVEKFRIRHSQNSAQMTLTHESLVKS